MRWMQSSTVQWCSDSFLTIGLLTCTEFESRHRNQIVQVKKANAAAAAAAEEHRNGIEKKSTNMA